MSDIPQQHFKINDPMVTKALNDSSSNKQKFGGWSYTNLVNLLAMVAYDEGMMDYAVRENAKGKKYDDRVLQCILWTVINRAGGDPNKFAEEILKKDQYYGVKHIKNRTANTYTIQHPGIGYDRKTWEKCNEFAILAIERTLPMPKDDNGLSFGKRNMIANKQIDNKKSYDSWGRKCDFTIGGTTRHYYGYDKTWDGWGSSINDKSLKDSPNTNIPSHYIVKSGDSIYKIAKKYNISIN